MPICMPRPSSLDGPENGALIPRVMSVAVTPGAVAVKGRVVADADDVSVVRSCESDFPPQAQYAATAPPARMTPAATASGQRRVRAAGSTEVVAPAPVIVRAAAADRSLGRSTTVLPAPAAFRRAC